MTENQEQPQPKPNDNSHIVDLVIQDMQARKQLGIERYGMPLQAFNGRNSVQDAYEEGMDKIFYMKQWLTEREMLCKELEKLKIHLENIFYDDKDDLLNLINMLLIYKEKFTPE